MKAKTCPLRLISNAPHWHHIDVFIIKFELIRDCCFLRNCLFILCSQKTISDNNWLCYSFLIHRSKHCTNIWSCFKKITIISLIKHTYTSYFEYCLQYLSTVQMYEQDATNTSGELKFNTLNLCKIFHENDMLHALSAAPS